MNIEWTKHLIFDTLEHTQNIILLFLEWRIRIDTLNGQNSWNGTLIRQKKIWKRDLESHHVFQKNWAVNLYIIDGPAVIIWIIISDHESSLCMLSWNLGMYSHWSYLQANI